jgi:hypothetical protein
MKEPRFDVYRLEVFSPVYNASIDFGIAGGMLPFKLGGDLILDVVIPDFDDLRGAVYSAFHYNIGELWITHLGERRLVTTCAQFEAEYGI